jgi:hypothetical protein
MNSQASVTDQLLDLVKLANKNGLYDAADWLSQKLPTPEMDPIPQTASEHFAHNLLRMARSLVSTWENSKPSVRVCELKSISATALGIANHEALNDKQ